MRICLAMLVACSLLGAAGPAAAQSPAATAPAPQPQPLATPASQPPERKAAGERTLNLNLDDASRRQIMRGSESTEQARGTALPSLGGDARNLGTMRSDPYPKTSDNLP
jgi:hypothetical protein